jgi:hypothetical protein
MNKFVTVIDGWKKPKVYYQDTDSLYIHQSDLALLKQSGLYHDERPGCGKNDLEEWAKFTQKKKVFNYAGDWNGGINRPPQKKKTRKRRGIHGGGGMF